MADSEATKQRHTRMTFDELRAESQRLLAEMAAVTDEILALAEGADHA